MRHRGKGTRGKTGAWTNAYRSIGVQGQGDTWVKENKGEGAK